MGWLAQVVAFWYLMQKAGTGDTWKNPVKSQVCQKFADFLLGQKKSASPFRHQTPEILRLRGLVLLLTPA